MTAYKTNSSGNSTMHNLIKLSKLFCFFVSLITFISTMEVNAAEKTIPGDAVMESEFKKLSNKHKIEKEFHLYAIDGYQKMADGNSIYIWGFTHAKDFADVGEIKTEEDRDSKLLPLKVPGDEIRLRSGKNYVIVLHNAGWYETEEHSGVNHVSHTIHFHGLDLIPYVDGVPKLPYPAVFQIGRASCRERV